MMVGLVGAGPGDPGLLTLRGQELIREADVIVYDALANRELLKFAKDSAELIYVGKVAGNHALPQDEINELLANKARSSRLVVRLKGGDPYIFGRGGEEGEYLASKGITFEVVPGITSAIAAPAYAGIPLTHRDLVSAVTIITGHEKPEKTVSSHDWRAYVKSGATLVFVMGVKNLPNITSSLLDSGMEPDMPAAIIYRGTTPMQRVLVATLATLAREAERAGFLNPAVVVIGRVVELHSALDWFSTRPLLGRTIVVTRARAQASEIVGNLRKLGAATLECPGLEIHSLVEDGKVLEALKGLPQYDWLIFTSVNGVKYFWEALTRLGWDSRALGHAQIAAIGPATAAALQEKGIEADLVPRSYVAESIVESMKERCGEDLSNLRILIPRAREARQVLQDELKAAGALVTILPIYESRPGSRGNSDVLEALENGTIDCITFGSSSTVKNFLDIVPPEKLLAHPETVLAAIGPITAETLKKNGLVPAIVPKEFTIPALIEAMVTYYDTGKQ